MAEKHAWGKVIKNPNNWDEVAKIMTKVMKEGIKEPYKKRKMKTLKYLNQIIEVIFSDENNITKIGNAWVRTKL